MTDWNPDDPDASRVHYDLADWNFEQQAELTAAMADADVPHAWLGTELVVPVEYETVADAVVAEVEARVDVMYGSGGADSDVDDGSTTEYDLDEWPDDDRQLVGRALDTAGVSYRWEGSVLVVPTVEEAVVEALLDEVERGEYVDLEHQAAGEHSEGSGPELGAEVLTTFFLAGERLRRRPLDADGLEQLIAAIEVADPERPPFGVQPRLWQQACEFADRVVDALVDDDGPDGDEAAAAANDLHDLLRPYV